MTDTNDVYRLIDYFMNSKWLDKMCVILIEVKCGNTIMLAKTWHWVENFFLSAVKRKLLTNHLETVLVKKRWSFNDLCDTAAAWSRHYLRGMYRAVNGLLRALPSKKNWMHLACLYSSRNTYCTYLYTIKHSNAQIATGYFQPVDMSTRVRPCSFGSDKFSLEWKKLTNTLKVGFNED